jgi:hypothetical protein
MSEVPDIFRTSPLPLPLAVVPPPPPPSAPRRRSASLASPPPFRAPGEAPHLLLFILVPSPCGLVAGRLKSAVLRRARRRRPLFRRRCRSRSSWAVRSGSDSPDCPTHRVKTSSIGQHPPPPWIFAKKPPWFLISQNTLPSPKISSFNSCCFVLRPLTIQINLTRGPGLELLRLNPLVYTHNYILVLFL